MPSLPPSLLGKIAWFMVSLIAKTMRIDTLAPEGYRFLDDTDCIYVLWHGRLFFPMVCFRNRGIIVLVSEHRDGEIITRALESAGYDTVRGSTTRGGARALAGMVRLAKQGRLTAYTPDGPKGPRWQFQPGAIFAAAKTGKPIVPLGGSAGRAHYFRSWDRFQLPMPFSRGVFVVGEPYHVPAELADEDIESHRKEIERRLIEVNRRADMLVGAKEPS
jgi:lysophospholipid acyltransferase (LPLAT)-like uncharacterized protein